MGSGAWHIEKRTSFKSDSFSGQSETLLEKGSLSIIVLGASGDLAKKKTFPALFHLFKQVLMPTSLLNYLLFCDFLLLLLFSQIPD